MAVHSFSWGLGLVLLSGVVSGDGINPNDRIALRLTSNVFWLRLKDMLGVKTTSIARQMRGAVVVEVTVAAVWELLLMVVAGQ